jgi:hypothetical protein
LVALDVAAAALDVAAAALDVAASAASNTTAPKFAFTTNPIAGVKLPSKLIASDASSKIVSTGILAIFSAEV